MTKPFAKIVPMGVTIVIAVAALAVGFHLGRYYEGEAWTRDAHIRADVVQIAPDVSGLVTEVYVHDNQPVRRGQPLFVVDKARFELAARRADAAVEQQLSIVAQLRKETERDRALSGLVSTEASEQAQASLREASAKLHADQAAADTAHLDLQRTVVTAPADGVLNDSVVRAGDYVKAGQAPFAMIDSSSFRVDGYFEETRLHGVAPGQWVTIHVMGESRLLHGTVESIAGGIADRERSTGEQLLPNINPTFNWVRLAQRIPVRIAIDKTSPSLLLIAGRTATVTIERAQRPSEEHAP